MGFYNAPWNQSPIRWQNWIMTNLVRQKNCKVARCDTVRYEITWIEKEARSIHKTWLLLFPHTLSKMTIDHIEQFLWQRGLNKKIELFEREYGLSMIKPNQTDFRTQHLSMHRPLEIHYDSVVDKPKPSYQGETLKPKTYSVNPPTSASL